MGRQWNIKGGGLALLVVALGMLVAAGSASAELTGNYATFEQCPIANPEVRKCDYVATEGGESTIGNAKVPLVNPVIIQGGFTGQDEEGNARMVDAINGVTMSKTPQPVPGGLLGLVPLAKAPPAVQALLKAFAASKLNQVNATLEFARPANEVLLNENNLAGQIGAGLTMPVKVHLENPLLGGNCYIGSSTAPLRLALTTGTTSPPPPNEPITGGFLGPIEFLEEGAILALNGVVLVDNSFAAPKASGCGGLLSSLISPIINSRLGLPSPAGRNTVILQSKVMQASAAAVRRNDEENP
jgi:hypothetical protein